MVQSLCVIWRFLRELTVLRFLRNSMQIPQKTKSRMTICFSDLTVGHISGEKYNLKRYLHPNVHGSTIYSSQGMEATYTSINRGMDKEDVVHIYNGILLSHRTDEIMPFAATWMDLEIIILSK